MTENVQLRKIGSLGRWFVVVSILISLGLIVLAGWFLALGPVAFYDTNFEVFGLREPLTDARKDALLAAHTAHQRFLFTVMLLANLCLLGACGYLFFRARR